MTDLPPDVRDRAAAAASDARREYDNATLYVNEAGRNLHIVDAVTAVLAPEIARPLQARIEELEAAVKSLLDHYDATPGLSALSRANARVVLTKGERP